MANDTNLQKLLDLARSAPMSAGDREAQRRSFAYGNTRIENARVTREMVNRAADRLGPKQGTPSDRRA